MMNRALLQRQMFRQGGAAVPNQYKGFSKLPEEVQMKMNPELARKYEQGGNVTQEQDPTVFDPNNPLNIARFFRDNPGTTVSDYNRFFGTNISQEEYGIFEKPKPMQEGGLAGLMQQRDMAAMPMGSPPMDQPPMAAQGGVDPNILASTLSNVAEDTGDLEQAPDFQSMMNQFSGEDKSEEERRDDLASIVGPEDAAQTPDSVLALVTPVVQISMAEEGIAPMAREAMDTPVQGDMAGGIMSMTGAGNEPPENFNLGGEVRRRGDEDPVKFFETGGAAGKTDALSKFDFQQNIGQVAQDLLPTFQKFMPATDPEVQKRRLQSDILFDIANTALAFSAPMQGERKGLSPAERLALAAQTTQLLPKIQARTAKAAEDTKKIEAAQKAGALQAAIGLETAREKSLSAKGLATIKEINANARKISELSFKKKENVSNREHEADLAQKKRALEMDLQKLKGRQDINSINSRAIYQEALQRLKGEQQIVQLGIKQDNELEKINLEYEKKTGLAGVNNRASMARLNKELTARKGIADANNETRLEIANNLNKSKELIADNRLQFDKKVQEEKLNQLDIENANALIELNLKKAELQRKKLKDYLDNQTETAKINLARRKLEEYDLRIAELKEFETLSEVERKNKEFEFKKVQENNLNIFRNNDLQIKRFKNVLENKKLIIEKNASDLTKFGTSLEGRTLSIISNETTLKKYAEGTLDKQTTNDVNALVTSYISPKTVYDEETKSFKTVTNKLPPEYITAAKERGARGLTIPDLTGLTDTKKTEEKVDDKLLRTNFMGTGQTISLLDNKIPKIPLDRSKVGATGSSAYLGNVLNLTFETLGFGQPFKGIASSKKELDRINVDLVNVILGDRTGKSALDERNEIRRILPDVNAFVGGDETAAGKISQVINFIDNKLETEITGLQQLYQSKSDFTGSASKVLRLKQLKAGYQAFLDAYNAQKRDAGGTAKTLDYYKKSRE